MRLNDNPEILATIGYVFGISGNSVEAERTLGLLKELSAKRIVSPYDSAIIYAGLGDKDKALELLKLCLEERSVQLIGIKVEPFWDDLRDDPRFVELLKKLGLEKSLAK